MTPEHFNLMTVNALAFIALAIVLIFAYALRSHGFKPYDGLTLMYDRTNQTLNNIWRKIPYRGQSVIIIGIWLIITGICGMQVIPSINHLTMADVPTILLATMVTGLGAFYIVEELRGKLRRKSNA